MQQRLRSIHREQGPRALTPTNYPTFVWLSDAKNRQTAKPVSPNQMAAAISQSVSIRSVTVEITDQSLSDELFKVFPWLASAQEYEKSNMVLEDPEHYQLKASYLLGSS